MTSYLGLISAINPKEDMVGNVWLAKPRARSLHNWIKTMYAVHNRYNVCISTHFVIVQNLQIIENKPDVYLSKK